MNFPIHSLSLKNNTQQKVASVFAYESAFSLHKTKYAITTETISSLDTWVWHFFKKFLGKRSAFYLLLLSGILVAMPVEAEAKEEGTWKTFIATAYYSPLPNQESYYLGSYEKDKRLNGGGERAADGTGVYAGMIAAPKTYAFGTKIMLDGLGVVSVHDRGGAIVSASNGSHAYDRIDIWMGHGDAGLKRTIEWGRRELIGRVVSHDSEVSLDLATIVQNAPKALDIAMKKFAAIGYTQNSGESVAAMITRFQLDYGVIQSATEAGAGNYGPKTTLALAEAYEKHMANGDIVVASPAPVAATNNDLVVRHNETGTDLAWYEAAKARAESMNATLMGERSALVQELKVFLQEKGYYTGDMDDMMTLPVLHAFRKYQHDRGLIPTGRNDLRTKLQIIQDLM